MPEVRVAIMQPYFLPYVGYYQLIANVDHFVIYDNIKYTKKGWINRNRLLLNGAPSAFSLPLAAASDSAHVRDRSLATTFDRAKLLNQIRGAYQRAPFFNETFQLCEEIVRDPSNNLFDYIYRSVLSVAKHLGVSTRIVVSSTVPIDHTLKSQDKVLAICKAQDATQYVNSIGGTELYSKEEFAHRGVELSFLKTLAFEYPQFGQPFVPNLSIIDLLMFNPLEQVKDAVNRRFELV
jgi:hypothetical protein